MKKKKETLTERQVKDKIKSTLNQIIIATFNLQNGPIMQICEEMLTFEKRVREIIGGVKCKK